MELIDNLRLSFLYWIDCNFKSTKKLGCDILGWLIKPKTAGRCGFPLTNLQKGACIDYVP